MEALKNGIELTGTLYTSAQGDAKDKLAYAEQIWDDEQQKNQSEINKNKVDKEYVSQAFEQEDKSCGEIKVFKAYCDGTVTVTIYDTDSTTVLFTKEYTDSQINIKCPSTFNSLSQLNITGEGKILVVNEFPIVIKDYQSWMDNVEAWTNCIFDESDGNSIKEHRDILNYANLATSTRIHGGGWSLSQLQPTIVVDMDNLKPNCWDNYPTGYSRDIGYTFNPMFITKMNEITEKCGHTPFFWCDACGTTMLNTFVDGTELWEQSDNPLTTLKLKGEARQWLGYNLGGLTQVGRVDVSAFTSLTIENPGIKRLLLCNLGCNANLSAVWLDSVSIWWILIHAQTVTTKKTITFSGQNYYELKDENKKYLQDKGWTIAVNWNSQFNMSAPVFKKLYDLDNANLLAAADDISRASVMSLARADMDNPQEGAVYASEGHFLTEAYELEDEDGRTFATKVETNTPEDWKEVTIEYAEEFVNKINQRKQQNYEYTKAKLYSRRNK